MVVTKAERAHKSKRERKRLAKQRKVKIVGEGRFLRRVARPQKHGVKVKSQNLRVAAEFADWCRRRAETEGSVTEVTRNLYHRIKEAEDKAVSRAL